VGLGLPYHRLCKRKRRWLRPPRPFSTQRVDRPKMPASPAWVNVNELDEPLNRGRVNPAAAAIVRLPSPVRRGSAPLCSSSHRKRCGRLLISIEEPEFADDLCAHFERSGFHAQPVDGGMIEVGRDDAPNPRQERLEIALHLRVWEAMNPAAKVIMVR